MLVYLFAPRIITLEFQTLEFQIHVFGSCFELGLVESLALFRTISVVDFPLIEAFLTKEDFTSAAFNWIFNNHQADAPREEVGEHFSHCLILLDQVFDLKMSSWLHIRFGSVRESVGILLIEFIFVVFFHILREIVV